MRAGLGRSGIAEGVDVHRGDVGDVRVRERFGVDLPADDGPDIPGRERQRVGEALRGSRAAEHRAGRTRQHMFDRAGSVRRASGGDSHVRRPMMTVALSVAWRMWTRSSGRWPQHCHVDADDAGAVVRPEDPEHAHSQGGADGRVSSVPGDVEVFEGVVVLVPVRSPPCWRVSRTGATRAPQGDRAAVRGSVSCAALGVAAGAGAGATASTSQGRALGMPSRSSTTSALTSTGTARAISPASWTTVATTSRTKATA